MADDLNIAPDDVRQYLREVQRSLESPRLKTQFGKDKSKHWFFPVFSQETASYPISVTLEIQRSRGSTRVYLTEIRLPTAEELAEIGADPGGQPDALPMRIARDAVLEKLNAAKDALTAPLIEEAVRGQLAYEGAPLAGDYVVGTWRISLAPETASSSLISERVIVCDRIERGRDGLDISTRLRRRVDDLSIVLTVLWMRYFYEIPSKHCWSVERQEDDGEQRPRSKLLQRGYLNYQPLDAKQLEGATTGEMASPDRLNIRDWGIPIGEPFRPPDDASTLFELFEQADLETAGRFVAAAKAYHTSNVLSHATPAIPTGAIAYLVVAAESLIEDKLDVCSCCHQPKGVSAATRNLFFAELPCLRKDEAKVKALLDRAYTIRSRHFHDAQFFAGELEQWHAADILMPDSIELGDIHGRLMALVNGLLVAWLVRRVMGKPWPRASGDFPDWREGRYFSVSVQLGGRREEAGSAPQGETTRP